MKVLSYSAWQF